MSYYYLAVLLILLWKGCYIMSSLNVRVVSFIIVFFHLLPDFWFPLISWITLHLLEEAVV